MTHTLVITGGSKGLGWAIAEKYLQNGWKVVSGSRSTRPNVEAKFQDGFRQIEMDVRDRAAHKVLVGEADEILIIEPDFCFVIALPKT